MAVLVANTVNCAQCDDCPRQRCIVTEREGALNGRAQVRVTVLSGCETCEGSTLVLPVC